MSDLDSHDEIHDVWGNRGEPKPTEREQMGMDA